MSDAALEVRGLTRRFGGLLAVDHVDLVVEPDELRAVIGPNGAGKTTLLDLVTGFTRPDEGTVRFAGHDVLAVAPHRLPRLGLMRTFQSARLVPRLSVRENIMLGGHHLTGAGFLAHGLHLPRARREQAALDARADAVLDFLDLRSFAGTPASDLPTGVQRLLEVGRALAGSPRLVLLDEPAAGLDEAETRELAAVLRAVVDAGTAIVLIEHDVEMVMSISDRILVLDAGAVVADGPPAAVRTDPAVLAAYLGDDAGEAPTADPTETPTGAAP